jgi:hypothetical protein
MEVADHGSGIPADRRERVFDRFYRGDPARTHQDGGAGLGLALARSLIEAQKGRLWLCDTPGGGLTVVVELAAASAPSHRGRRVGGKARTPANPSVFSGDVDPDGDPPDDLRTQQGLKSGQ